MFKRHLITPCIILFLMACHYPTSVSLGAERTDNVTKIFAILRPVMNAVDAYFRRTELAKIRLRNSETDIELIVDQRSTFADQIGLEVARHVAKAPVDLTRNVTPFYAVDARPPGGVFSFAQHPLCRSSRTDLKRIFRKDANLLDDEVELAQAFEKAANAAFQRARKDPSDTGPLLQVWGALTGCLAYAESLGDADGTASVAEARRRLGSSYRKPPGVKVYYDKWHNNEASRLNLGLYQFVLTKGGNTSPCLAVWKELELASFDKIDGYDKQGMANFVGSSAQSFNAFCGLNKIAQSLYVTAYTREKKETHPDNIAPDGSLKPPADRCVSPFHRRAYSHFSPLTRGVVYSDNEFRRSGNRSNFHKIMRCTAAALTQ